MRVFFLLLILTSTALMASDEWEYSNEDEYVKVPFNLGLWPGISIGDMMAEESGKKVFNNGFVFNLGGGRADRLRGAEFSGLFSIYREGIQGFQASGIFNITNGNVRGFQGAGIFNLNNGDIKGVQSAGIFNMQNGSFQGLQGSAIFNMQNGNFKGVQGTGVFNLQNGDFRGLQVNGVFALQNGNFQGAQVSEIFNISNGNFNGLQIAGVFNILNGGFNGWQIGGVNILRHFDSGVQIGLVNIAESHNGLPVGLFTWVKDIPIGYQVYYDDMQFANFAVRSGNRQWYNLISVGRRIEGDIRYHTIGGGFGKKTRLGYNFGLDAGISGSVLLNDNFKYKDELGYMGKLSLVFHYALPYEGSLFIGPVINAWYSKLPQEDLSSADLWVDDTEDDYFIRVWPGFVVGIML